MEVTKKSGRPLSFRKTQEDRLAREFLEDTADLLEEHWTRGTLHDGAGNHCAVGGMIAVAHRKKWRGTGVYQAAKKLLCQSLGITATTGTDANNRIYDWNDNYVDDGQEVVRGFRKASAK